MFWHLSAQCDVTPDDGISGPVYFQADTFQVTNIGPPNGSGDCEVSYKLVYHIPSNSCSINYLQALVTINDASTSFVNLNWSGSTITHTETVYGADCSGTLNLSIIGGWAGGCPSENIPFPGNFCYQSSFGLLPVELESFNAKFARSSIKLNWTTLSESSSDYFEVQHSRNGIDFSTISIVKSAGNSDSRIDYDYNDKLFGSGLNYYRLKQVDQDGKFEFSSTETVEVHEIESISVWPNPVTDGFINFFEPELVGYEYNLQTLTGHVVMEGIISEDQSVNIDHLNDGVYFFSVSHASRKMRAQKIIVQR